jgi:hypothetical protein
MRKLLLAASTLFAIAALPVAASAQVYAADVYAPPPPGAVLVNPPVVGPPLVESQVFLPAPGAMVVAPGTTYDDQAIYVNGQRYYRDCWWDWGRRRCELKPWY